MENITIGLLGLTLGWFGSFIATRPYHRGTIHRPIGWGIAAYGLLYLVAAVIA